jgi:hypothetical protein
MSGIKTLKSADIATIINGSNYDVRDLLQILYPISQYFKDDDFVDNLKEIIQIIITDRDNNQIFTMDDLKLLGKNLSAITSLVTSILLLLTNLSGAKYKQNITEEIILKILAYIFLIIIPKETNTVLSTDDKNTVLNIMLLIYNSIKSSQIIQNAANNIASWLNKNNTNICCLALPDEDHKENIIKKKLLNTKIILKSEMLKNRETKSFYQNLGIMI